VKRAILIVWAAVLLFSCGPKNQFTISGTIDGGAGKTLYFSQLHPSKLTFVDSVKLDKKGNFELKGTTSDPTFYLLQVSNTNFVTLLLDSADRVTIEGNYANLAFDYDVEGSANSKEIQELNQKFAEAKAKLDSLRALYNKNKNNPLYASTLESLNIEYASIANAYAQYASDFVKRNPFSPANIYALYQQWEPNAFVINDLQLMKTTASALSSLYPNNDHVKALYNNTLDIMRKERSMQAMQLLQQSAVNSPDINLPDQHGINRSLWSLQGKYVLLQFWSAKDRTSRVQNQVLNELYAQYRNRGFEIYMVSIDNDRAAWLQAIAEDNMPWINVGDMKGSYQAVNSYNIQAIPSNYILDKEGQIVAKNLQGPALTQALARIVR
jgi:peroxiredoxin